VVRMSPTRLFLFTGSYPFSAAAEGTFLPQELSVLSQHFDEIILVPLATEGDREDIALPNVTVDVEFASFRRSRFRKWVTVAKATPTASFLRECAGNTALFARHPAAFKKALVYNVQAEIAREWMRRRSSANGHVRPIIYTWWFDAPTLGLARFAREAGATILTRAHGYDLYEDRHMPPYIPFRRKALQGIDFVYADSKAGSAYLAARYAESGPKVGFSPLGVADPGFLSVPSSDGKFRIVSCSFLTPVKRIDLLIRGLASLGASHREVTVSWVHIGDGPEKNALSALARHSLPPNIHAFFPGYPGKKGLYDFYRDNPVDLFVNVSESEGTPVSMMEAISLGIPVLCTAVGGNTEVAGPENGHLLPANPSAEEVAAGIESLMQSGAKLGQLRLASRGIWDSRYNASKNYTAFAESIRGLRG
jgi:colanic acid/amylovoran biosynthesis glycosyltransferase